jgi:hypothetical protein
MSAGLGITVAANPQSPASTAQVRRQVGLRVRFLVAACPHELIQAHIATDRSLLDIRYQFVCVAAHSLGDCVAVGVKSAEQIVSGQFLTPGPTRRAG